MRQVNHDVINFIVTFFVIINSVIIFVELIYFIKYTIFAQ
ncbi:hypothetical protein HmCmsJML280_03144 [Escherichia coli]|nr:hypothetical protein HmCmsJML280_03144 [Escherichia coli]